MAAAGTVEAKGHTGQIVFDGSFVTISRKGLLGRVAQGKGEKRIPLSQVSSVQWKPAGPVMNGFLSLSLAGGVEKQSRFGQQTSDAVHDENSVVFTKKQQPAFEEIRSAIETAIAERQSGGHQPAPADADPVAQLAQLAQMHDAGNLSDDEFNAAKARILGS